MTVENDSSVTDFLHMGLTDQPGLQLPLFFLFLVNFLFTVVGNSGLINLICVSSHLHSPMYIFLFNLSFIDVCYSFVFTSKMLLSLILERTIITFSGCMAQLFFFCFIVSSECYVLTAMAYDRYVTVCKLLLYTITMSPQVCSLLMSGSYMMGFAVAMAHTGCMIRLNFCDSNIINHYIFPLLRVSFSSTYDNELVVTIIAATVIIVSILIIFISYALILFKILHMPSAKSWSKAFNTCSSHLITVGLFCAFGLLTHVKPSSAGSLVQGKYFSVFYTNVVPMLYPLIYSLRNKDVNLALKKTLQRITN